MKKILFPTEFSSHAPEVFRYAAEMAWISKSHLIMMHAFNQPEVKVLTDSELIKMADEASARLLEFAETHLPESCRDVKIEYVTKSGFASQTILDTALEEGVELIVMGMTGKTNALDKLFGSTSLEVLDKADCPLLIVPADARFEGIDNLIYLTNFEFRDLGGIAYFKKWSRAFDAPIHCLHILEEEIEAAESVRNMSILMDTFKGHKNMHFDIIKGTFPESISGFAKGKRADIIAMISHKRNFILNWIGSTAVKGVARKTSIPLLVIKDNPYEINTGMSGWMDLINSIA